MAGSLQNQGIGDQYQAAKREYQACKQRLTYWATNLSGTVDIVFGLNMQSSVNQSIANLQAIAALPGLNTFAQQWEDDPTFDAVAAVNNLVTALQAIATWIAAHIPTTTYSAAQTAPLLAKVQAAQATLV